ncbi:hypothetical protein FRB93_011010 [Tulasnella sp. JGI-2019a]|nr:hypothetical protein FRB93_011010 [Tulasnella sp. JGI-2019a]
MFEERLSRVRSVPSRHEIIPNLWLGGWLSARHYDSLKEDGIFYVLSVLKGDDLGIDPRLTRYQIEIDDVESSDLLIHLPPAVAFIQKALESSQGILVHCAAGISRSPSVVAAYLMFMRNMDVSTAISTIREKRSFVDPNDSFIKQLELFHAASCSITNGDKAIRAYYLERAIQDIRSGKTPKNAVLTEYNSNISLKARGEQTRKIRCKMCRTELASRDHVMEHGQADGATPEAGPAGPLHAVTHKFAQSNGPPSNTTNDPAVRAAVISKRVMESHAAAEGSATQSSLSDASVQLGALGVDMMTKAVEARLAAIGLNNASSSASGGGFTPVSSTSVTTPNLPALQGKPTFPPPSRPPVAKPSRRGAAETESSSPSGVSGTGAILDDLRTAPTSGNPPPPTGTMIEPKCSGYFLEPMKWMDFFLEEGLLEGKIICPNAKCGVKLGNYAWAGVSCSCQNWVTPGFCVHRSKVDEIW